jgi:hypothetical protein
MAPLDSQRMLAAWQAGRRQPPLQRALTLLAAAEPTLSPAALYALPIGDRDRALLALHGETFGSRLEGLADCRVCGETIEIACGSDELMVSAEPAPLRLRHGEFEIAFRTPSSEDIAEACAERLDPAAALARRCIVSCTHDGASVVPDCPPEVLAAVSQAVLEADPVLDLEFAATCPACGSAQMFGFDIVTFLWQQVETRARHLLTQVHLLASAYGWSESDILALPAERRVAYLDLVLG